MSEFKESFRDEFLVSYYCDNNEKKLWSRISKALDNLSNDLP